MREKYNHEQDQEALSRSGYARSRLTPKTTNINHSPTAPIPPTPQQSSGSESPPLFSCISALEYYDAIHGGQETVSLPPRSYPINPLEHSVILCTLRTQGEDSRPYVHNSRKDADAVRKAPSEGQTLKLCTTICTPLFVTQGKSRPSKTFLSWRKPKPKHRKPTKMKSRTPGPPQTPPSPDTKREKLQ